MTLANEINTATRSLHTRLNALITSRLPLALPPHSSSPDVYLTGLIPFAQVFYAFEAAWDQIEEPSHSPANSSRSDEFWVEIPLEDGEGRRVSSERTMISKNDKSRSRDLLVHLKALRPARLARTARLQRDIACLAGISVEEVDSYLRKHSASTDNKFINHIASVVNDKPHVLIAYAFVMYMAIFSGGRWIRSVLAAASTAFWSPHVLADSSPDGEVIQADLAASSAHEKIRSFGKEEQAVLEDVGLSFWFWTGMVDGLDIKADFKAQLETLDALLTDSMRDDVLKEAGEIFVRCEGLVGDLDERVGRQGHVLQSFVTTKRQEWATEKQARSSGITKMSTVVKTSPSFFQLTSWSNSSYAGLMLVIGCISCIAIYQASVYGG